MDTQLLKTFLEVSRTRHFGKAADNLYVTQSTVSARIRQLEETVGTPLFTRNRNDIQLTHAGQRLLRYAENIVTTWNRARQEIAIEEGAGVPLTVAGAPSLWDITLQDWLHATYRAFPQLALTAEVLSAEVMTRRLLDGTLDLAFLFEHPRSADIDTLEIARIPLVMVSSKPHPSVAEAVRDQYILVDWGTSFATSHARLFPDLPAPGLRLGLGRMARDFLHACGGTSYLAKQMVAGDLEAGLLHLIEDAPVIERTAYAAFASHSDRRSLFMQLLGNFYPQAGIPN